MTSFCLFVPALAAYAAKDDGMRTTFFYTDVTVGENNTLYVTERISVEFLEHSHGIFRYIPFRGEAESMVNGEIVKQDARMKITVIDTGDDNYTVSKTKDVVTIRIGDADKYILGNHDYTIRYKLELFDDRIDAYDSVYLNVIPQDWTTDIDLAMVSITFPKDADVSGAEFIGLENGVTSTDIMAVEKLWPDKNGNYMLVATSKRPINYGEGLTFRTVLPEGYFIGEQRFYSTEIIFWIIVILAPLLCFFFWFRFGRDLPIVETVEVRPPEGLTPAEIGLFWDGKIQTRDLTAMFLYWAHQGKLNIEEFSKDDIWLHKQGDIPAEAKPFEKKMFNGLFIATSSLSVKTFPSTVNNALNDARKDLLAEYGKDRIKTFYDKLSLRLRTLALFIALLPAIFNAVYAVDTNQSFDYGISLDGSAIAPVIFFAIFILRTAVAIGPRFLSGGATSSRIAGSALFSPLMIIGIIALIICGVFILGTPLQAVFSAVSTAVCIVFALLTRKKTKFYTQALGRIRGFANFIKTAELDRIKMLVNENPAYFFDILPYAWAMELTDKWAEKFDSLGLTEAPPSWYYGYSPGTRFTYMYMVSSLGRSTGTMESILANDIIKTQAAARSSSGGGFSSGGGGFSSGGGFSGGGFGGGGGGRW